MVFLFIHTHQKKDVLIFHLFLIIQKLKKWPFSIFPFVYNSSILKVFSKLQSINCNHLGDFVSIIRGFECGYKDSNIGHGKKN